MKIAAIAVLALAAAAGSANADLIAAWRFPEVVPPLATNYNISFPIAADVNNGAGPAQITTNAATFTATTNADTQGAFQYFTGTTVNALAGDVAGSGLGIRGLTIANPAVATNGKHITFRVDTTNFQDIVLSYAERLTSAGPTSFQLAYSTNGVDFTDGDVVTLSDRDSTFRVRTIDLSSIAAIENTSAAYIRWTFTGYTSASGGIRIDNVQINGTLIPAPGVLALVGMGGLLAARRRR